MVDAPSILTRESAPGERKRLMQETITNGAYYAGNIRRGQIGRKNRESNRNKLQV
jgi:hypothetical protein